MNESHSRQRQQAEDAFNKAHSPRTARDRAFDEIDAIKVAAEEKTSRLREARLTEEAQRKVKAAGRPAGKRAKKLAARPVDRPLN